ncbi:MAG TPA: efflux RND transporter periplasmic adaptor subunit [Chitinophagaceae bacterium]|nr:efflux RND transporter periplasmic adaptor subunit [Chitinophagaceae bacterium]
MKKALRRKIYLLFAAITICTGCQQQDTASEDEAPAEARTPVTVTSVSNDTVQQYIELNATSSYLQKSFVKSNMIGYVKKAGVKIGDYVHAGQPMFVVQTKESQAIRDAVNNLNPDFKFSGINTITANSNGFITELDHQPGDYVQDGEQLAVISDSKSFAFIMSVPYEDKKYVSPGLPVEIALPDNERITGAVSSSLPLVDSVSQTQNFIIKVNSTQQIPPNLVATVKILKVRKPSASTLPKQSVLTDETQSEFWIMKMVNDSIAVKVPVKKGIETDDKIEILSPVFSPNDKIILTGNYGLSDTALVTVQK